MKKKGTNPPDAGKERGGLEKNMFIKKRCWVREARRGRNVFHVFVAVSTLEVAKVGVRKPTKGEGNLQKKKRSHKGRSSPCPTPDRRLRGAVLEETAENWGCRSRRLGGVLREWLPPLREGDTLWGGSEA